MQDIVFDNAKVFYKNDAMPAHSPKQYNPYQKIVTFDGWVIPAHYKLMANPSKYV